MMEAAWPDDGRLIRDCEAGDAGAWRQLVARHYRRLHGHAWRILMDAGSAEDITQEVLLKLWTGRARFDPARGAFVPWLLRITTNACLDARRRLKPVASLDEASHMPDPAPGAHESAETAALMDVLATLPHRQRAALALFYLEGFTMAEVAVALETNAKAVEGLLSRGKEAMRDKLAGDYHPGSRNREG